MKVMRARGPIRSAAIHLPLSNSCRARRSLLAAARDEKARSVGYRGQTRKIFECVRACRVESDALQGNLSAMPHRRHFAPPLLAVSSLTSSCAALADEPKQVAAVLKLHEVQFVYRT